MMHEEDISRLQKMVDSKMKIIWLIVGSIITGIALVFIIKHIQTND